MLTTTGGDIITDSITANGSVVTLKAAGSISQFAGDGSPEFIAALALQRAVFHHLGDVF